MSSAAIWSGEGMSAPKSPQVSVRLREATLDDRLSSLREVALMLLDAVDSLRSAQPVSRDRHITLQDEVHQFETDLIRAALAKTGGNQAHAARLLGVKHTTLNAKIKRYRISGDGHVAEADKGVGDHEIAA
jgi:transcriptional regulator with GAF, ATPase, and Fis domain